VTPAASARTSTDLAYTREGSAGASVLLLHAGIADRRMWDRIAPALATTYDVIRLDLRGFGESDVPWAAGGSQFGDVVGALGEMGVERVHVIAVSFGAGVAAEVALVAPHLVASLLLVSPGGSLIAERTPELAEFIAEEDAALERGDLDAAADANVRWWVDGPRRTPDTVASDVRDAVAAMQRRAFEITADWEDDDEEELVPGPLDRLGEIVPPVLLLTGDLDIDAVLAAAEQMEAGVPRVRRVRWPDVANVPPMERPDDFVDLARAWLGEVGAGPLEA
jgi:3-oxoadipate enol-lactonase